MTGDKELIEQNKIETDLGLVLKTLNEDEFECVYYHKETDKYRATYSRGFSISGGVCEPDSVDYDSHDWYEPYTKEEAMTAIFHRANAVSFMTDVDAGVRFCIEEHWHSGTFRYMTKNELRQVKVSLLSVPDEDEWTETSGHWDAFLHLDAFISKSFFRK